MGVWRGCGGVEVWIGVGSLEKVNLLEKVMLVLPAVKRLPSRRVLGCMRTLVLLTITADKKKVEGKEC